MRLSLSLLLSGIFLAATKVAAGGYQGALERVLLYYAYQIDGLNNPDNRQLGYKCGRWANGECQNNAWTEFRCGAFDDPNKSNGKRCNFYELMTNLGETQGGGADNARRMMAEGVDVDAKTLPVEKSAVKFYMYTRENMPYIDDNGVQQKGRVGDYNSYRIMRYGGTDYNEHLNSLGDIVRNTAAKKNDGNKWMWDEFESTLGQLRAARIGDNGRYVVDAYKNDPKLDNKYITTENPGTNPATKDEYKNLDWYDNHKGEWTDFNWAETEENMHKGGVKDASDRMSNFRNSYFSSQSARDHQAVMNDFQAMETKVKGCK